MDPGLRYSDLMSSAQVAAMFGVTVPAVFLWRRDGGLPHMRIPGYRRDTVRFHRTTVLAWAKKNGKAIKDPTDPNYVTPTPDRH